MKTYYKNTLVLAVAILAVLLYFFSPTYSLMWDEDEAFDSFSVSDVLFGDGVFSSFLGAWALEDGEVMNGTEEFLMYLPLLLSIAALVLLIKGKGKRAHLCYILAIIFALAFAVGYTCSASTDIFGNEPSFADYMKQLITLPKHVSGGFWVCLVIFAFMAKNAGEVDPRYDVFGRPKAQAIMWCRKCGAENPFYASECALCGGLLTAQAPEPKTAVQRPGARPAAQSQWCKDCGAEHGPHETECRICGGTLSFRNPKQESGPTTAEANRSEKVQESKKFCPNCGTECEKNARFCGSCGSRLQ